MLNPSISPNSTNIQAAFIGLPNQPPELQALINNAVQHIGPVLGQALIKKLVARQTGSKAWFQAALFDENFPSDKVTVKDKELFLQKVMRCVLDMIILKLCMTNLICSLRGARGTNEVVREFWLDCRGSNFAYAS